MLEKIIVVIYLRFFKILNGQVILYKSAKPQVEVNVGYTSSPVLS